MASALLVVDIQKFYLPDLPDDLAQRVVNHQQALQYDVVAFAVFQNSSESNFVRSLKWTKCDSDEDARLPTEFDHLVSGDNVFKRDCYSAFYAPELHDYLQSKGVDRLVICGVDTDACVLASSFDAFDLGYHVKLQADLTFSTADLQKEAEKIIKRNLESRD